MTFTPRLRRVAVLQFFFYLAFGCGGPFFAMYYRGVILTETGVPDYVLVGLILSLQTVAGIVSPLLAGILSDMFRISNRIITLCGYMVTFGLIFVALPGLLPGGIQTYAILLPLMFTGAIISGAFIRPIMPILDSETMLALREAGNETSEYGRIRLFGSAGWIIGAGLAGILLQWTGNLTASMIAYGAAAFLLGTAAISGFRADIQKFRIPWKNLTGDRGFWLFLVFVFLINTAGAAGFTYTGIMLEDAKVSYLAIGLIFSLASLAEFPVLHFSRRILKKLGTTGTILTGSLILMLKLGIFIFLSGQNLPVVFILIQSLHAMGFAFYHFGCVHYMDSRSHEHIKSTYQSVYQIILAASMALGSFFGGMVLDYLNVRWVMILSFGLTLLSIVYFIIVQKPVMYRKITESAAG